MCTLKLNIKHRWVNIKPSEAAYLLPYLMDAALADAL